MPRWVAVLSTHGEPFAPEKVFSDMIEAVLGAVYIDTGGDLKACDALLRGFGIIDWVETALKKEVQIRHPNNALDGPPTT